MASSRSAVDTAVLDLPARAQEQAAAWDQAQQWLLRAAAVLLPLVVVWDAFDRFVLPKLLLARLFGIAMLALFLLRAVVSGRWRWRRSALDVPLLLVVASTALSAAVAVNRNVALFGMPLRYEGLLTILTYAGIFWLALQLIPNVAEARNLGRAMMVGAAVVSLIAIYGAINGFGAGPDVVIGNYVRAFGSMGSPVELGIFLAMILPFALAEVLEHASTRDWTLAAAALVIIGLGLVLTFTRGAWIAAIAGCVVVVLVRLPDRDAWLRVGATALAFALGLALVIAVNRGGQAAGTSSGDSLGSALGARAASSTALDQGTAIFRVHLWSDALTLVGRRPLLGYGPDSFGLVYPSVDTGDTPGIDKAHNDVLQVAVTNGLPGVLAYYLLVAVIVVQLWRSRRVRWLAAMFAGLVVYFLALQTEFSWIPAAMPFWLLTAAAFAGAIANTEPATRTIALASPGRLALAGVVVAAGLALAYFAVIPDLYADRIFAVALTNAGLGDRPLAQQQVATVRQLNPHNSVYAVLAGNLALDMQFGFRPGPNADLIAARDAYRNAIALGTTDPGAYRGLAVADAALQNRDEAIASARRALALDHTDPENAALLQSLLSRP